jgi:ABC-type multidrug transport system fused ATPase/permease subunit
MIDDELENILEEVVLSRNFPGGEAEENHEKLYQEIQCPGRNSYQALPEYKSTSLSSDQPVNFVVVIIIIIIIIIITLFTIIAVVVVIIIIIIIIIVVVSYFAFINQLSQRCRFTM